jgi:hypothetical protein
MGNELNRWCASVFLVAAVACGGANKGTVTSPSPTPPTPMAFSLDGRVIDGTTSAPIAGAAVSINAKYRTTTDSSGHYRVTGVLDAGLHPNVTSVSANDYASDVRSIQGTSQTVRLHRIERMVAGDSTVVTVAADDSLCLNTLQDMLGLGPDYVCRSVRVVAPIDGVMTLEAVSTHGGARPPLEVEIVAIVTAGKSGCCAERIENPTSMVVTAGTEVVANVEMLSRSTNSQSFTVNTSMRPR